MSMSRSEEASPSGYQIWPDRQALSSGCYWRTSSLSRLVTLIFPFGQILVRPRGRATLVFWWCRLSVHGNSVNKSYYYPELLRLPHAHVFSVDYTTFPLISIPMDSSLRCSRCGKLFDKGNSHLVNRSGVVAMPNASETISGVRSNVTFYSHNTQAARILLSFKTNWSNYISKAIANYPDALAAKSGASNVSIAK